MERVKGIEPSSSAWKSGNAGDGVGVKKPRWGERGFAGRRFRAAGLGGSEMLPELAGRPISRARITKGSTERPMGLRRDPIGLREDA
jgi:hypothetical protein